MKISREKLALCILKEISKGNTDFDQLAEYEVTKEDFGSMIEELVTSEYLKNAIVQRGGQGNPVVFVLLNTAYITIAGEQFLHDHSGLMKFYKGLKELRDWIPLP